MIDPKVKAALEGALNSFAQYNKYDAVDLTQPLEDIFASAEDFLTKVDLLDTLIDQNPPVEGLREVFFDLLMINFFAADVKSLEDDYLETEEWEEIEEETLERGTELLNLLLYLNECADEDIEPELDDYLKEFLLVDDDEFQDEYLIYEPVIANQILIESDPVEIKNVALGLDDDTEIKEIFYPMMCFFQNPQPTNLERENIAINAVTKDFDMPVLAILERFL
jgi:hypothetical protein